MFPEAASDADYYPQKRELTTHELENRRHDDIRELVADVMHIQQEYEVEEEDLQTEDQVMLVRQNSTIYRSFAGAVRGDSADSFDRLDKALQQYDMQPLFREQDDGHIIHLIEGRFKPPKPMSIIPNVLLFLATIVSVLIMGARIAANQIALVDQVAAEEILNRLLSPSILIEMWRGLPYALSLMIILVAHEGGHYLMMRRHNVDSSLPYFLPLPFIGPFGTLGAAIILRGPIRNRRQLLDVGAAGPIAGLVFTIPILIFGLATSQVMPISGSGIVEGNSIVYAVAKIIAIGEFVPNGEVDVLVNQMAWAGWTGLFVTALNLIPLGQLDGGHVLYSILGKRARRLYIPLIAGMLLLTFLVSSVWWLFLIMLFLFGRVYAVPLDDITPLDPPRRNLAIATIVIFLLIFVPVPLSESTGNSPETLSLLVAGVIALLWQKRPLLRGR